MKTFLWFPISHEEKRSKCLSIIWDDSLGSSLLSPYPFCTWFLIKAELLPSGKPFPLVNDYHPSRFDSIWRFSVKTSAQAEQSTHVCGQAIPLSPLLAFIAFIHLHDIYMPAFSIWQWAPRKQLCILGTKHGFCYIIVALKMFLELSSLYMNWNVLTSAVVFLSFQSLINEEWVMEINLCSKYLDQSNYHIS